ncbi:hypothetical protein KIW84_031255, partial [Lathyrus oleraceus]
VRNLKEEILFPFQKKLFIKKFLEISISSVRYMLLSLIVKEEKMAIGINKVHFFIAMLCIASVLTSGGVIDSQSSWTYCIGQGPCPNNDSGCSNYCQQKKISQVGKCIANQCCCTG